MTAGSDIVSKLKVLTMSQECESLCTLLYIVKDAVSCVRRPHYVSGNKPRPVKWVQGLAPAGRSGDGAMPPIEK